MRLARLGRTSPGRHWGRLLFSAKESVFKAWSPLTGLPLGFQEVDLCIDLCVDLCVEADADSGTFLAKLPPGGPVACFEGRWLIRYGLIVTTVALGRHQFSNGSGHTAPKLSKSAAADTDTTPTSTADVGAEEGQS